MTEFDLYFECCVSLCYWRWARTASWPQTIRTTLTTTTTAPTTRWASTSTTTCAWKWLCGSSCTRRASYDSTCTSEFTSTRNDIIMSAREGNVVTGKMTTSPPAWSQNDSHERSKKVAGVFFPRIHFFKWQLLWWFSMEIKIYLSGFFFF